MGGNAVMTSNIPTTDCANNIGNNEFSIESVDVTQEEKDKVGQATTIIGTPVLVGGALGVVGGAFGAWGGFTVNKKGMCGEGCMNGIGGGFMVFGGVFALFFAAVLAQ